MQLKLGEKIKALRKRDGRTQDDLAKAFGVTCQAVSRWESDGGYPDMELIPSIANYFGVSIDELFGYRGDREQKINEIIERIDGFHIKSRGDDGWVDECLSILREGVAEFPQNERLLITLADTLSEAGWRRHHEWLYYDDEGFIRHDYDRHRKNEYWSESVRICEQLAEHSSDSGIVTKAVTILVLLYRNFGDYEKAAYYAKRMPELKRCRELLLAGAADGKEEAAYIGDFLLKAVSEFSEQLVYGLITNLHHYESDMPIEKIRGAIALFELVCDDGNMGPYHDDLIKLYLYLSRLQWERGYHDDAFGSLDRALEHARALEKLFDGEEHILTAPLVSFVKYCLGEPRKIAEYLPGDWPFWCNPDYSKIEAEIKADPRWEAWVQKTRG
ncbi:MAG: helix-turn-helix transcriptional regulator [Oscillospiraceae bacterium]|nr:helix-turn-helix transcriptional regulator [Oscillospiraceae bacterium]